MSGLWPDCPAFSSKNSCPRPASGLPGFLENLPGLPIFFLLSELKNLIHTKTTHKAFHFYWLINTVCRSYKHFFINKMYRCIRIENSWICINSLCVFMKCEQLSVVPSCNFCVFASVNFASNKIWFDVWLNLFGRLIVQ